jgi:ribonuclease T2
MALIRVCFFLFFCFLCLQYGTASSSSPCSHYKNEDFDYFLLSIQWPGTVCKTSQKTCRIPSFVSNFTIHGLWPNSYTIYHGPSCCKDIRFDMNELKSIEQSMEHNWPSFFNPNEQFWSHEWLKHGTCSQMDQLSYFKTTLDIKSRLNILGALSQTGIVPSENKLTASKIAKAIETQLGVPVLLSCTDGAYLTELHFCLTKDWKFIDCPSSSLRVNAGDICDSSVYFLPIQN